MLRVVLFEGGGRVHTGGVARFSGKADEHGAVLVVCDASCVTSLCKARSNSEMLCHSVEREGKTDAEESTFLFLPKNRRVFLYHLEHQKKGVFARMHAHIHLEYQTLQAMGWSKNTGASCICVSLVHR